MRSPPRWARVGQRVRAVPRGPSPVRPRAPRRPGYGSHLDRDDDGFGCE
ncbi:excalibur calcium-binding domain-containing protein [Nitriliruptor alkaliphilus]